MLFFDHSLFMLLNADAQQAQTLVPVALWLTEELPTWLTSLFVLSFVFGPPAVRRGLLQVLASLLLASLAAYLMRKGWPHSPRPFQLGWGMQWLDHTARASFPSMHATIAFALAQAVTLTPAIRHQPQGRVIVYGVWIAAFAISWSRICLGVHIPSDILGGLLVGTVSATAVAWTVRSAAQFSTRGRFSTYWSRRVRPSAPRR
ncbi:phosphatase PAP2 family protein [Diaphorobacter sp.]|uniref:phosphatase PAP2 family protein n=1 Tax=Diaphorobacter sp. TaxID=1934310 RepID=UPI0028A6C16D|nr:phosphatase PAP2 family protein [Diaphorobacter sp.]